jgi:hypothetical protein
MKKNVIVFTVIGVVVVLAVGAMLATSLFSGKEVNTDCTVSASEFEPDSYTLSYYDVATGANSQIKPYLNDNRIVWLEASSSNQWVKTYDFATQSTTTVSTSGKPYFQHDNCIYLDGEYCHWRDVSTEELMLKDFTTGNLAPITKTQLSGIRNSSTMIEDTVFWYEKNSSTEDAVYYRTQGNSKLWQTTNMDNKIAHPKADDGYCVFTRRVNDPAYNMANIMVYDIAGPSAKTIGLPASEDCRPVIQNDYVYFLHFASGENLYNGYPSVYGYRISTDTLFPIYQPTESSILLLFNPESDILIFKEYDYGNSQSKLVAYNPVLNSFQTITTVGLGWPLSAVAGSAYGDKVVYSICSGESKSGAGSDQTVMLCDLGDFVNPVYQIIANDTMTGRVTNSRYCPRIFDNRIVWVESDLVDSNTNIYGCTIQ